MLATLVGKGAAWSVATLLAIEAPANPPTNAILRVSMFASVSCWAMPQAGTAALAELGPLGSFATETQCRYVRFSPDSDHFADPLTLRKKCHQQPCRHHVT